MYEYKLQVMLITEPFKHRVGVYHQDTLDFMVNRH